MEADNELKKQISLLFHETMKISKVIIANGDYSNLLSLCEQDITILSIISKNSNITAKEISDSLNIPKTTVVTAVKRLENRGYINRMKNEEDNRELFLSLTNKGMQANHEHLVYEQRFIDSLADLWSKDDQYELAEILNRRKR